MREKAQELGLFLKHMLENLAMWLVLAILIVVVTHIIYHTAMFPVNLSFLVSFALINLSQRALEVGRSTLPERFYSNIWIRSIFAGILFAIPWFVISRLLKLDVVLFVWKSEFTFALLCALSLIFSLLFLLDHNKKLANI
jgi:hypothetical protein